MNWIRGLLVAFGLVLITATASAAAQAHTSDTSGTALVAAPAANTAELAPAACTRANSGTVAHFTLYFWTDYGEPCITFYGSSSCTAGYTDNEGLYDLTNYGWSDVTESVRTYNRCDVRFYDMYYCPSQGTQTGWIDNSPDLGAWRNRASCVLVS